MRRNRISDANGTLRCWIRGGVATKWEVRLKGVMHLPGGASRAIELNIATEVFGIGNTAVEIPPAAEVRFSSKSAGGRMRD